MLVNGDPGINIPHRKRDSAGLRSKYLSLKYRSGIFCTYVVNIIIYTHQINKWVAGTHQIKRRGAVLPNEHWFSIVARGQTGSTCIVFKRRELGQRYSQYYLREQKFLHVYHCHLCISQEVQFKISTIVHPYVAWEALQCRHVVSNPQQLVCLLKSVLSLTPNKISKLRITSPLR